jgi:hypothetical protein
MKTETASIPESTYRSDELAERAVQRRAVVMLPPDAGTAEELRMKRSISRLRDATSRVDFFKEKTISHRFT